MAKPEFEAYLSCVSELELSLKDNCSLIIEDLNSQGLLKSDVYEQLKDVKNNNLSSKERSSMIVTSVREYIEIAPANYNKFIKIMKKHEKLFADVIKKLEQTYKKLKGEK